VPLSGRRSVRTVTRRILAARETTEHAGRADLPAHCERFGSPTAACVTKGCRHRRNCRLGTLATPATAAGTGCANRLPRSEMASSRGRDSTLDAHSAFGAENSCAASGASRCYKRNGAPPIVQVLLPFTSSCTVCVLSRGGVAEYDLTSFTGAGARAHPDAATGRSSCCRPAGDECANGRRRP
jgi:hypothetical protein